MKIVVIGGTGRIGGNVSCTGWRTGARGGAGTRNQLAAEREARVKHHLALSIVGCDRLSGGFRGSPLA